MSWYVHPSKQLRDDELPPELVVTNRDGSVEQVYVPYNASDQLEAENAKLRERIHELEMEGSDHFYRTAYAEDANRTLEAENAKLRELVRMMLRVAGVAEYATDIEWQTITHYLRELGMEVDDGNH